MKMRTSTVGHRIAHAQHHPPPSSTYTQHGDLKLG